MTTRHTPRSRKRGDETPAREIEQNGHRYVLDEHVVIPGGDPGSQLQRAVVRYVEEKGGIVAVIGEVQVQQWPGEPEFNFIIGVKCTGRKPIFDAAPEPKKSRPHASK